MPFDDDTAIRDYERVCEVLDEALSEIARLTAALLNAREELKAAIKARDAAVEALSHREPGPATQAMLQEAKKIFVPDPSGTRHGLTPFAAKSTKPTKGDKANL